MEGEIVSINTSSQKGQKKFPVETNTVFLKKNYGIVGDAHSGSKLQVSLLSWDDVLEWAQSCRNTVKSASTKIFDLTYGMFAENIDIIGLSFKDIKINDVIKIIDKNKRLKSELKVVQIGKYCHTDCEIKTLTEHCIMPQLGVFAEVLQDGEINIGDHVILTHL